MSVWDSFETAMTSPLFLGGAALASGEGFNGAVRGMQAGVGFRDASRKRKLQDEQDKFFAGLDTNPALKNADPGLLALAKGTRDTGKLNEFLAGTRGYDLDKMRTEASVRASNAGVGLTAAQTQLAQAQLAQARQQTPEARAVIAKQYGIDPNSPEGKAFVLNGTFAPPSLTERMMADLMRGPQQSPQQPSPVRPQSFEGPAGSGDPNLIPTQTAPSPQAAPPPQTFNTPVGPMTEDQAKRLGFGLGLMGKGDAGKMLLDEVNREKLGKEAANENDKKELAAIEGLSRIRTIAGGFKPEWLTYENRAKQYGISWLDSFETLRGKLKPEDLKSHIEYTAFVRDAISNLTQGIKDATGAAMGIQEEARIRAGLPDPQKDGPTQFAAKLAGVQRELGLTIARTRYLRTNGFKGQPWTGSGAEAERVLPIDQFRRIIDQDGDRLQQQYRASRPQAPQAEVDSFVKGELRSRYGIGI